MSKKPKEKPEKKITIPKRQPGKAVQTNFMQNLRKFPTSANHPVDDLLGLSAQAGSFDILPADIPTDTLPDENLHPDQTILDTQTKTPLHPEINSLDTQENISGHPTHNCLDTQNDLSGHSNGEYLDIQLQNIDAPSNSNSGHSKMEILGANTPKKQADAPRNKKVLDTLTPRNSSVMHPKNEKWRNYDEKRSTDRVNIHISKEINKKIRQYCFVDSTPRIELKEFFEAAAMHYLNFLDTQNISVLGAQVHLDDRRMKMLYKTRPFIINLYLQYNTIFNEISDAKAKGKWSAKWTPRDDETAQKYNELNPQIVELGIIQTQINKGIGQGKIQTFKYYTDEIEKVLNSGVSDEMLSVILNYHRKIWKDSTNREIDLSFLEKPDIEN